MNKRQFWWLVEVDIDEPEAKAVFDTMITGQPHNGIQIGRSALPEYFDLTMKAQCQGDDEDWETETPNP